MGLLLLLKHRGAVEMPPGICNIHITMMQELQDTSSILEWCCEVRRDTPGYHKKYVLVCKGNCVPWMMSRSGAEIWLEHTITNMKKWLEACGNVSSQFTTVFFHLSAHCTGTWLTQDSSQSSIICWRATVDSTTHLCTFPALDFHTSSINLGSHHLHSCLCCLLGSCLPELFSIGFCTDWSMQQFLFSVIQSAMPSHSGR